MRRATTPLALLTAAAALLATAATAEEIGKTEFMNACASCHGPDAAGDGPMAAELTTAPPPLTGLAKANGGTFPMDRVIRIIDGRDQVRAHGSDMPVWGAVFKAPLAGEISNQGAEMAVRGRILSLAYYLESIQED